jgi:hypothetical protein
MPASRGESDMRVVTFTVYIESEDTEAAIEALRAVPGLIEFDYLGEESY